MVDAPRLFVFGMGYSAWRLAGALLREGWRVAGTTRDQKRYAVLEEAGIEAFYFSREEPLADPVRALAGTSHLLTSIVPDERGDPVLDCHLRDLRAVPELRWVGYLSTTGVYGDSGGGWVDEDSALSPTHPRSQRRVAAERAWLESGLPAEVFRLAGIYGPGRNQLDQVLAGRARHVVREGQVFSRVHVDDVAGALRAAMAEPHPGRVLNLVDDEPAAPADVLLEACRLLGVDPPPPIPFEEAKEGMSPMALSFWSDNRRVSNRRLKEELGYSPRYPTYREGLAALFEHIRR